MSLLSIESVSHRYRRGRRECVALAEVSLTVEAAELVAVHGTRKSGKSTLMRIAAGLERPDEGVVRFEGVELATRSALVGRRVAFVRTQPASFSALEGELVVEHVAACLLAQDCAPRKALRAAEAALTQVGAEDCGQMTPADLDGAERARVGIARALVVDPKLVVVDEPTAGVGVLERDPLLAMLRAIANAGTAVLMSAGEAACVSGADRVFALDEGEIRHAAAAPEAEVVPLWRARSAPSARLDGARVSEHP